MHYLSVAQSYCIGQVSPHSERRADPLVGVCAGGNELTRQLLVAIPNGKAEGRLVVELLRVHNVGIRAGVQEDLHYLQVAQFNRVCQVRPYSEIRGHSLVGVCARIYQNLRQLLVSLPNGKAKRRLVVKVALADGVQVFRAQVGQSADSLGVAAIYRAVQGRRIRSLGAGEVSRPGGSGLARGNRRRRIGAGGL